MPKARSLKAPGLRNQTSIRFGTVTSSPRLELKSPDIVRHKLSGQFRWQVAMYTVAGNATDDASGAPRRDGLACEVKLTCRLRTGCRTKSRTKEGHSTDRNSPRGHTRIGRDEGGCAERSCRQAMKHGQVCEPFAFRAISTSCFFLRR